jgi:hypothetical protein
MKTLDTVERNERMHYFKCTVCGHYFDRRDLGQVFEHEHNEFLKTPKKRYESRRRIMFEESQIDIIPKK